MSREAGEPPVVLKIGGSLFDLPDLAPRISRLLAKLGNAPVAIVAGGGRTTDVVRDWDRRFALGPSASHWLAIHALELNDRLLRTLLESSEIARSRHEVLTLGERGRIAILSLADLLGESQQRRESVPPESWDVTTDSLAAWVAGRLGARLVLAKSVDRPSMPPAEAAAHGFVDRAFAQQLPAELRIDWVNLRAERPDVQRWVN